MLTLPDEDLAVARLAPLFPVLHEALDHGTAVARRHYELEGGTIDDDPLLFASIARFHANRVLGSRGQRLPGFARTPLAKSGIQMAFAGYQLRCWKTTDGELPAFAPSAGRQRFVRQLLLESPVIGAARKEIFGGANLVVQWEYVRAIGLVELTLACPKPGHGGVEGEPFAVHWSRPIPRPSEALVLVPSSLASVDVDEDLHFIRRRSETDAAESS